MPIDVALIHVSPPDEHGFCSFGVGVDTTKTAAECARVVIAQVNPRMPRTLGDSFIHVNKIHHIVEVEDEILEHPQGQVSPTANEIGRNIAGLIEDGSTLQLGIGEIPDAVLHYLTDKKDLGIHTEMVSDGIIDLIEKGVLTNEKKTLHPGKIILGFVLGTRRLYDFIDNNPVFEFHPSQYTNDPFIISRNDRMVAINSALEVDLTGQVCADSLGYSFYSGIGGQVDFMRGSARSEGRQAHHHAAVDGQGRRGQPDRAPLEGGRGRRDDEGRRPLRDHGVRRRLPARQDHPGTLPRADRHRASRFPRGARTGCPRAKAVHRRQPRRLMLLAF